MTGAEKGSLYRSSGERLYRVAVKLTIIHSRVESVLVSFCQLDKTRITGEKDPLLRKCFHQCGLCRSVGAFS